jgi:hypothetical protein
MTHCFAESARYQHTESARYQHYRHYEVRGGLSQTWSEELNAGWRRGGGSVISSGRLNRVLVMMWQLFSYSCDKPCPCSYVTILIIIKSQLIALILLQFSLLDNTRSWTVSWTAPHTMYNMLMNYPTATVHT